MTAENPKNQVMVDLDRQNPWLGLASYSEQAQAYFFGRERETSEVFRTVRRESLTVLFGQSGLGKTSLLNAGLFPRLRENDFLPIYIRIDHSAASPPHAEQIKGLIRENLDKHRIDGPRPEAGQSLWEYFHLLENDLWSPRNRLLTLVLVFDQFEETFTLGRSSEATLQRTKMFLSELADLVEGRPSQELKDRFDADPELVRHYSFDKKIYKIILCLREDYLPHLESLRDRIRAVMRGRLRLTRMNGLQALEAVKKPGAHLLETGLAEKLVAFVAIGEHRVAVNPTEEQLAEMEIEPALLSVVCRELNNKRIALGREWIDQSLLVGSHSEILSDFYERSLEDLPEQIRVLIEEKLLTRSGFRDSVALEEFLEPPLITREIVEVLVNRRLLRLEERFGVARVELTHDTLTAVIQISRDRRREKEARIEARKKNEELRRKLRRNTLALAFVAVLVVVLIGALIFAIRAKNQATEALKRAAEAKADSYTLEGHHARDDGEWGRALLFYQRSLQYHRSPGALWGAEDALGHFLPQWGRFRAPGPVWALGLKSDQPMALVETDDHQLGLLDIWSQVVERKLNVGFTPVGARFSPLGRHVAVLDSRRVLWVFPTEETTGQEGIECPYQDLISFDFSPDGRRIALVDGAGMLRIWDFSNHRLEFSLQGTQAPFTAAAYPFHQEGLILGNAQGGILYFGDLSAPPVSMGNVVGKVTRLAVSPSGLIAALGAEGRVFVFSTQKNEPVQSWPGGLQPSGINNLWFLEGSLLCLAGGNHLDILDVRDMPWNRVASLPNAFDETAAALLHPGSHLLISALNKREISIRGATGLHPWQPSALDAQGEIMALSEDGKIAAIKSTDGPEIKIVDIRTGKTVHGLSLSGQNPEAASVVSSPGPGRGMALYQSGKVAVFDLASGKTQQVPLKARKSKKTKKRVWSHGDQMEEEMAQPTTIAMSPQGNLFAIGFNTGHLYLGSTDHPGDRQWKTRISSSAITALTLSRTGSAWAVGTANREIRVERKVRGKTDRLVKDTITLPEKEDEAYLHIARIQGVSFSPDARLLASFDVKDPIIRVWDLETRRLLCLCQGHGGRVREAVFSGDGRLLISAGEDRTLRFWSLPEGNELLKMDTGISNRFLALGDSKNGQPGHFVVLGPDGNIRRRTFDLALTRKKVSEVLTCGCPQTMDDQYGLQSVSPLVFARKCRDLLASGDQPGPLPPDHDWEKFMAMNLRAAGFEQDLLNLRRSIMTHRLTRKAERDVYWGRKRDASSRQPFQIDSGLSNQFFSDGQTPLTLAAAQSDAATLEELIKAGADPDQKDDHGRTPLEAAALSGNLETLACLRKNGADTPLALENAARHERWDVLSFMFANGIDVNIKDRSGQTLLAKAVRADSMALIEFLLQNKADPQKQGRSGPGILALAAQNGNAGIFQLLLEKGADPLRQPLEIWRALMSAPQEQRMGVAEILMKKVDLSLCDSRGWSAWMLAAEAGDPELALVLTPPATGVPKRTSESLNPFAVAARDGAMNLARFLDDQGEKPGPRALGLAAANARLPMTEWLLEHGALADHPLGNGRTPLMLAAMNEDPAVARALIDHGADVNRVDDFGQTGLHLAAGNGNHDTLEILLDSGADLEVRDHQGRTPLDEAVVSNRLDCVTLLLNKGADVNQPSGTGKTPLHLAMASSGPGAALLLLKSGARIDQADLNGMTPLMIASESGDIQKAKLLISAGASPTLADRYGWSALTWAVARGRTDMVHLLMAAGADKNRLDARGRTLAVIAGQFGRESVIRLLR